jgi:hypothetical protein
MRADMNIKYAYCNASAHFISMFRAIDSVCLESMQAVLLN